MESYEVVQWLVELIALDTRNPPGNEAVAVEWLTTLFDAEGIPWTRFDHGEGRASVMARLRGEGTEGPLCLVSHLDTVGVEADRWSAPPLEGLVRDGFVWGRGALDMKGMLAVELAAFVRLSREGVALRRDVIFLAVADEEVASLGMRDIVEHHWGEVGCEVALNEGGLGLVDALFDGQTVHAVSVAERGVLWMALVATAEAGHGSVDLEGEAIDLLRQGIDRVERLRFAPKIDPSLRALFAAAGRDRGGFARLVLTDGALTDVLVRPRLMRDAALRSALTDTVHLTGLQAGSQPNVVPGTAVATFDARLLPGTDPADLLARLEAATAPIPGLAWRVIQSVPARGNAWDTETFAAIADAAVAGRDNVVVGPALSVGFTDSLFLRAMGVTAYGWVPFEVDRELAATMHGADERVPVSEIVLGAERLYAAVVGIAAVR